MTEAVATQEAPSGKGGLGKLLLVAVLCLGLGAGGAYFALGASGEESAAADPAASGESKEAASEPDRAPLAERLLPLEPFVVNVNGDKFKRFLKAKIELEAESVAARAELDALRPQVRDSILILLSSKRLDDLGGFEGKAVLKQEIAERVNGLVEGGVRSVLVTEFVIQ